MKICNAQIGAGTDTLMSTECRKILVVDDEPDIRNSVADILNEFGYEADTAADGAEALAKIRSQSYDVALLDFKMPGMNGLALYHEMRRICPETSAILVSAYTGDGVAEEAINSGIRRVISKPVDMSDVIAQVDQELERPLALIVDDDPDFCESLRDILAENGLRVGLANDEATAAALVQSRHPHVVVLDIVLGADSDAARILDTIYKSSPEAGVIIVSGHNAESVPLIKELSDNSGIAVCYKPIEVPQLLEAIRKHV